MSKRRVVVTGLGAVTPIGNNVKDFWAGIREGKVGIGPITKFDTTDYKVKIAAEVKDFNAKDHMDPRSARRMDPFCQYAVTAAKEALEDSGIDMEKEDSFRAGVIVGSGIGSLPQVENNYEKILTKGPGKVNPLMVPMMISNMAAGNISIQFGLRGKCTDVVTACASGSNAIGEAMRLIRHGYADAVITGGAEAAIVPSAIAGFVNMQALSTSEDPDAASLPFDKRRGGFVIGEGAACLILEEYEHAKARGAKIYGEVCGYGVTCDAYHITAPRPDARGGAQAMMDAMREAGYTDRDIVYVNAHGTGTPMNDVLETAAIKKALGEDNAKKAYVSSTKSMTGHMLGAAGAIEALACLFALNESIIPPTINLREQDEACDLNCVPNTAVKAGITLALSNSLGFGGHNACLAFRKV